MSETSLAQLEETLKVHGYSLTRPRKIVLQALQNQEPQTMRQVVAKCADVDRASVYRTIILFERLGIVQRLQVGWKYQLELSDAFHDHHHHATCVSCGKLISLPEDIQLERRLRALAASYGFALHSHQLELSGLCRNCRTKQKGAA